MKSKNESHTLRPPILDGTNYFYWKQRMKEYIKAIDKKTCKTIIEKWVPHVVVVNDVTTPKP